MHTTNNNQNLTPSHNPPPPHRVTKFNGVTSLLMYIPSNLGAETTKIYYIGLRGEFAQVGLLR